MVRWLVLMHKIKIRVHCASTFDAGVTADDGVRIGIILFQNIPHHAVGYCRRMVMKSNSP